MNVKKVKSLRKLIVSFDMSCGFMLHKRKSAMNDEDLGGDIRDKVLTEDEFMEEFEDNTFDEDKVTWARLTIKSIAKIDEKFGVDIY